MKYYTFEIVIEREDGGRGFSAYSPNLPGCFSDGRTVAAARKGMRAAIRQHLAALLSLGKRIPRAGKSVLVEELTVGVR